MQSTARAIEEPVGISRLPGVWSGQMKEVAGGNLILVRAHDHVVLYGGPNYFPDKIIDYVPTRRMPYEKTYFLNQREVQKEVLSILIRENDDLYINMIQKAVAENRLVTEDEILATGVLHHLGSI